MSKQRLKFSVDTQTSVHNRITLVWRDGGLEIAHLIKLDSGNCIFGADESIFSFVWSCRRKTKSTLRPDL